MTQIFLDCDGVLADFDAYAFEIFGFMPEKYEKEHGTKKFWLDLSSHHDFYYNLPLMPGARELFYEVKKINHQFGKENIILTGLPRGNWAEPQKLRWRDKYFPDTKMICCLSANKRDYLEFGDILIDDKLKYSHLWIEAGGIFIHHTNIGDTLNELQKIKK